MQVENDSSRDERASLPSSGGIAKVAAGPKRFVVAKAFTHPPRGATINYFVGESAIFTGWTSDADKAQEFDTRALARRRARVLGRGAYVEVVAKAESR